jgi:acetyl esterase/lipase
MTCPHYAVPDEEGRTEPEAFSSLEMCDELPSAVQINLEEIMMKKVKMLTVVPLFLMLFLSMAIALAAPAPPPAGPPPPLPSFASAAKDVVYVPGSNNPMHKLDIYTPMTAKPSVGYPLIVYVHGGGFARGDKFSPGGDDFRAAMKCLDSGFMVASINYRLSGTDTAPAQIVDTKAAVRYLKANAAKYGFNPAKIFLMGVSAGASIASAVGTSAGSTAFDTELASIGAVKGADDVAGVISLFGLFNFANLQPQYDWLINPANKALDGQYLPAYAEVRKFFTGKKGAIFNDPQSFEYKVVGGPLEASNPMIAKINAETYIGTDEPPFFIRHGDADENIPFLQSVDFAKALKARGNKIDFALVPGAQHGLPGANFFKIFDEKEMINWLKGLL